MHRQVQEEWEEILTIDEFVSSIELKKIKKGLVLSNPFFVFHTRSFVYHIPNFHGAIVEMGEGLKFFRSF